MTQHVTTKCNICGDVVATSESPTRGKNYVAFDFAPGNAGKIRKAPEPHNCQRHICYECLDGLVALNKQIRG